MMRRRRPASLSWIHHVSSSWKSLVLTCLALFQVLTIYLLLSVGLNRQDTGQQPAPIDFDPTENNPAPAPRPPTIRKSPRRILSVVSTAPTAPTKETCVPQTISPGRCSNVARTVQQLDDKKRQTCSFDLDGEEVVFGVWHSLATEGRLQPLLETWGRQAQVVLLASSVGVRESKLFREGAPGSHPHLLDTGIEQDDYFSTLGKAFVGLRLMLEAYPTKKWFVVLGDDNYVLIDNYVNLLSAFDPEEPWALSRMVHRNKFGCKVAGGASVITSRSMTQQLSPHLEPWYRGIVERSGGNVNKASEEDKFHDIAFQKLVEHMGHSWVHLDELPHEPPGFYFDPRLGGPKQGMKMIPERSALFHYVSGNYMHYLDFVSSRACSCGDLTTAETASTLSEVAIGVYSPTRRLSKLDKKRIEASWGKPGKGLATDRQRMLVASGREHAGIRGDLARLEELSEAFPDAEWFLLLPVEHYVVAVNLAVRIRTLEADTSPERRRILVYGPPGNTAATDAEGRTGDELVESEENADNIPGEGALLVGRDLAQTILHFKTSLSGGVFPARRHPGDRYLVEWARTLSPATVIQDAGFMRRVPPPRGATAGGREGGEAKEEVNVLNCPATFPMEPDLADLKPEVTMSEEDAVMFVTGFLLQAAADTKRCSAELKTAEVDVYEWL